MGVSNPDRAMCDISWCASYAKPGSSWCVVHELHPGFVPRNEAIKHNWLKRQERARATELTSRQDGASNHGPSQEST